MTDAVSGNQIANLSLELDAGGPVTPSACGGAVIALAVNGELWDAFGDNGNDCITSERIHYDANFGFPVTTPSTTAIMTRSLQFWNDILDATPGTQWQTHDPAFGARVGLQSGQPLFMSANMSYLPPGAGSSFYRQLCTFAGADYTLRTMFVASANTDTLLSTYLRWVDNNNNIQLTYTPATTTFELQQTVAGVTTSLATAVFDLTTDALNGHVFDITITGGNITIVDASTLFPLTYVTGHLTGGPPAFLIIATGANASGFGGLNPRQMAATH